MLLRVCFILFLCCDILLNLCKWQVAKELKMSALSNVSVWLLLQERRKQAEEEKTAMEEEMKRAEELIKARKEQATTPLASVRQ
jgi:hypothetical protein